MWDPDDVEWWLEVFDGVTDALIADYLLATIAEEDIRAHFGIDPAAEPLDGIVVSEADVPWLSNYTQEPLTFDAQTQAAFVCVHARRVP